MALHLMTSSKKGISSLQMSREVKITIKSAWFLTHRIREAMRKGPMAPMLKGTVEVDETYVGGKPRKGSSQNRKRGRGTTKQPVLVLVERDGNLWAKPIENTTAKTLKNEIAVHVAKEAVMMTDELHSYWGLDKTFAGHETVTHGAGEYSRKTKGGLVVHTNTGESFFALLKRGHYGIFHQLSKKHLHRYCNEFSFRWDHRKVSDGERMVAAIKGATGKRLMYHHADCA
jgi:transposase-like protein